jgi:glycine C-acetyltransferase
MPLVEGNLKRLDMIRTMPELREKLWTITRALQVGLRERGFDIGKAEACVTPVFLQGNIPEATNILIDLRENHKIFCSVVVYPVVPKGVIMFRIIPTSMHSLEDVEYTLNAFGKISENLAKGVYKSEEMQDKSTEESA